MITRYAPTPSGFCHQGNLVNFATTAALAEIVGAQIVLRIDDDDAQRMRQAYVNDIFDSLRWLDLPWSVGPRSPSELPEWS